MKRGKHTPAPWTVGKKRDNGWTSIDAEEWEMLAAVATGNRYASDGEAQANALLISAAPELLDACEEMIAAWNSGYEPAMAAKEKMCAAINKAKGLAI